MKKILLLVVFLCLLFFVTRGLWGSASIYPPTNIPFPHDPNNFVIGIIGFNPITNEPIFGPKCIGGVNVRAGQEVIVTIDVNDPDKDPFSVRVLNWQAGMNLTVGDANTPSLLKWRPTAAQEGLHYVHIESWDFPPDPNGVPSLSDSLTDKATIVYLVRPRNRAPILLPWSE